MSQHTTSPGASRGVAAWDTDVPMRVTIEPAEPAPGKAGAWFKVWESTVFGGLLAQLSGGEVRMFWVLAAHREREGVLSVCSEAALCRYTGRSLFQIRATRRALCSRDGGRICLHHGGDVYELMPDEPLLGRRASLPAAMENPTRPEENRNFSDGKPNGGERALRAQNQPTKDRDREIGQTRPTRVETESRRELSRLGVVGWPELTMFGEQAAERGDLAAVLRDLGAGDGLVDQVAGLAGLTVGEILRTAEGVAGDPKAINRPYCLCARLAMARGKRLERPEIGRAARMGAGWAELARVRVTRRGAGRG